MLRTIPMSNYVKLATYTFVCPQTIVQCNNFNLDRTPLIMWSANGFGCQMTLKRLLSIVCNCYSKITSQNYTVNKFCNMLSLRYQTFIANIDYNTVVENRLPTPIVALCIRLYPLGWFDFPCLRMEVLGCIDGYSRSVIHLQEPLVKSQGISNAALSFSNICHNLSTCMWRRMEVNNILALV